MATKGRYPWCSECHFPLSQGCNHCPYDETTRPKKLYKFVGIRPIKGGEIIRGGTMRQKKEYWIPRGKEGIKKGALSKQLGIPERQNIPMGLLEDIKSAQIGAVIRNRHGIGKREIKITAPLKKRANLAQTLKRLANKKRTGRRR